MKLTKSEQSGMRRVLPDEIDHVILARNMTIGEEEDIAGRFILSPYKIETFQYLPQLYFRIK